MTRSPLETFALLTMPPHVAAEMLALCPERVPELVAAIRAVARALGKQWLMGVEAQWLRAPHERRRRAAPARW
ncbi:MAG: hypothetical protein KC731_05965 [Myxococcales bacterium]|nr:hypothetical protein [Myxococcales bacterium]